MMSSFIFDTFHFIGDVLIEVLIHDKHNSQLPEYLDDDVLPVRNMHNFKLRKNIYTIKCQLFITHLD